MIGLIGIIALATLILAGLEIDFYRQRRALSLRQRFSRRRCTVTLEDAAWLMAALDDIDCPVCDRLLANHRR